MDCIWVSNPPTPSPNYKNSSVGVYVGCVTISSITSSLLSSSLHFIYVVLILCCITALEVISIYLYFLLYLYLVFVYTCASFSYLCMVYMYVVEMLVEMVWAIIWDIFWLWLTYPYCVFYMLSFLLFLVILLYLLSINGSYSPILCPFSVDLGTSVPHDRWFRQYLEYIWGSGWSMLLELFYYLFLSISCFICI